MADELPEKVRAMIAELPFAQERIARLAIVEATQSKDREIAKLRAKVPPKMYPIMNGPSVPWEVMLPHAHQAKRNHGQTLERLAERGGLGTAEAWAVVNGEEISCLDQGWWAEKDKFWRAYADRINLHYAKLAELQERLERAEAAITEHNAGCVSACQWRREHGSCAYRNPDGSHRYGNKNCRDCPEDSIIDALAIREAKESGK